MRHSGKSSNKSNRASAVACLLTFGTGLFILAVGDTTAQNPPQEPPPEPVWEWDPDDPRIGLTAGVMDAETAILNLERLVSLPKPEAFLTSEAGGRGPTQL